MSENQSQPATSGGIGFCGLLTVLFIGLKLTGHINWGWGWVLSPIWIPIALFLAIFILGAIVICIYSWFRGRGERAKNKACREKLEKLKGKR